VCARYDPRVLHGAGGWRGRAMRCVRPEPLAIGNTQEQVHFSYTSLPNPGVYTNTANNFFYKILKFSVISSEIRAENTMQPNNP
jgi:hypothetical protein